MMKDRDSARTLSTREGPECGLPRFIQTARFAFAEFMLRGVVIGLFVASTAAVLAANRIESPDGNVVVGFSLQEGGFPAYEVQYLGKPLVAASRLGFEPDFTNTFSLISATTNEHRGSWTNAFGELRSIPDNYRELNIHLKHGAGRELRLIFRAYNEGAAFRYSFPVQSEKEFHFSGEHTEFCFPDDTFAYEAHGTEGEYRYVQTAAIRPFCEKPLTLEFKAGFFASLAEAANEAYPRMMLSAASDKPGALLSALGGETANTARRDQRHDPSVVLYGGEATPWRLFVLGKRAGDLLERNYLLLNLNPQSKVEDTSWIRPGKVIREMTLTTTGGLACVDFAVRHGLQYVHFDAGWYGSERTAVDATGAASSHDLDLRQVIDYGASHGVGVVLYVNKLALRKQIDILPALYQGWGVRGMKVGFVDVGPQTETAWISEAIRKAAAHHIMVNIHDGYRATGNSRTWPNLMTVEGIRGNEHMPAAEHNCTLPFTRYVGGIGDYTVCYYSHRIKTTHAHQLAMAVVSFSPLQYLFWYDKPSDYQGEPEVEFFREVPTVWDETRVINGKIGRFATIARRNGDDWFVGTINSGEARELKLPLMFLKPERKYTAHIYEDDDSVETRTKVGIRKRTVDSETVLTVALKASGGQAIWITEACQAQPTEF